jgi:hypothetical protein
MDGTRLKFVEAPAENLLPAALEPGAIYFVLDKGLIVIDHGDVAAREAWGHQVQALNHRNAASAARAAGRNAMTGAWIGAGASLLTAASPWLKASGTGIVKPKNPYTPYGGFTY